jgi:acyl carrier protein
LPLGGCAAVNGRAKLLHERAGRARQDCYCLALKVGPGWGAMFAETWMSGRDDELIDIISEEALIDRAKLDRAAKLEDIGLDSVDLVSVVFAIEEKYGIEIAEDAFDRSDTLGAVLTKIDGLIDAKAA